MKSKDAANALATLLRFAGVGVVTTLLDTVLFAGLTHAGVPPAPANLLSYSCGIAVSYGLNRRWTFRAAGSHGQAVRFALSMLLGLAISTALVATLSTYLPPVAAKVVTVPIVFLWNFAASRFWVFAKA